MSLLKPKTWFKDDNKEKLAELSAKLSETLLAVNNLAGKIAGVEVALRNHADLIDEKRAKADLDIAGNIIKVVDAKGAAVIGELEALAKQVTEQPVCYDVQLRMADNKIVDLRVHGDKGNAWSANDQKPPFKIEQRHLKPSEAEKIKASLK